MSKSKGRPRLNIPFKLILILGAITGFIYYLQSRFDLFEFDKIEVNSRQPEVNGVSQSEIDIEQPDFIFVDGDRKNLVVVNSFGEELPLSVKIAKSRESLSRGLMFRKSLPQNEGMVFIYDKDVNHKFWMKNCYVDLDMIFLNKNWEIVDIVHSAKACYEDPCPTYGSKQPYRYVLEVNAGFAESNSIKVGNLIKWQRSASEN
ncbi:hypothetical protein GF357_01525 [Candidatus Dojkabacteria bacterium]|nr:hypothetical protein [Candidatus Dojkabacteria bacterium]